MRRFLTLCALFVVLPCFAYAQQPSMAPQNDDDKVIANVDFEEGKIVKEGKKNIVVSFDIINHHTKVLADLVYAVQLLDKNQTVMFEKIYSNDHVTLGPKKTLHKELSFAPPKYLEGVYTMRIVGRDTSGTTLENYVVDTVMLEKAAGASLKNRGCLVYLQDEQFLPTQGIDIAQDEELIIECEVINDGQEDVAYSAQVSVFDKSPYNHKKPTLTQDKEGVVEANISRKIRMNIPTPQTPGYYDATLTFLDKEKTQISNPFPIHFVVQGVSGTIGHIRFDKNTYKKGEHAQMQFIVTGSADTFEGSRAQEARDAQKTQKMTVDISLTSDDKKCANDMHVDVSGEKSVEEIMQKVTITQDCMNPVAHVTLKDAEGTVLDEKTVAIAQSEDGPAPQKQGKKAMATKTLIAILIVALISVIVIGIILKNSKRTGAAIFFLACGFSLLVGAQAHAGQLVECANFGEWTRGYCYWDVSTNKCLGETFTAEAQMDILVCRNKPINMMAKYHPTQDMEGHPAAWTEFFDANFAPSYCGWGCAFGKCKHHTPKGQGGCVQGLKNTISVTGNKCVVDKRCKKQFYDFPHGEDYTGSHNFVPTTIGNKTAYFKFRWYHSDKFKGIAKKTKAYTVKDCTVPQCTVTFDPSEQILGTQGTLKVTMKDDADNHLDCKCNYENSNIKIAAGEYPQKHASLGKKFCNCTAKSKTGKTATCSGETLVRKPKCTGTLPAGATLCPGDNNISGTEDIALQAVNECTTGRKCEYTFPPPKCGTAAKEYPWDASNFSGTFCDPGDKDGYITFPGYGNTVTWTCKNPVGESVSCEAKRQLPPPCECHSSVNGKELQYNHAIWTNFASHSTQLCGRGTVSPSLTPPGFGETKNYACTGTDCTGTANCSIKRGTPPECACGSANNTVTFAKPTNNLCTQGDASSVSSSGEWAWHCGTPNVGNDGTGGVCTNRKDCSAQCIDVKVIAPSSYYVDKDGNGTIRAKMKLKGRDKVHGAVQCAINGKDVSFPSGSEMSDPVDINVSGNATLRGECKLDVSCGGTTTPTLTNPPIPPVYVTAMCVQRDCNAQGKCQATPKPASGNCTSTCSSDADCRSGRLIETRP